MSINDGTKKQYPLMFFEQPIGSFGLTTMNAADIIKIMTTNPLSYDPETATTNTGHQRELDEKRLREIADYAATDPDACFPTAIILALNDTQMFDELNRQDNAEQAPKTEIKLPLPWKIKNDNNGASEYNLELDLSVEDYALIVDGQHRMYGLKRAGKEVYENFTLPVVFLFNSTLEQLAIIFSIINGKQTKVSYSLVAQLFSFIQTRSEEKVAQSLSSALNARSDSPFYRRVKMLGRRLGQNESLAQGTMVREFIRLLKGKGIFYDYYNKQDDITPLKILTNYFSAAKQVWPAEWEDHQGYILTRTVGFTGLVRSLPELYMTGREKKDLSLEFFYAILKKTNDLLVEGKISLISEHFTSNAAGANKLKKIILEAKNSISL